MKKAVLCYVVLMLVIFCAGSIFGDTSGSFPGSVMRFLFIMVLTLAGCQDIRMKQIADGWHVVIAGLAGVSCVAAQELFFFPRAAGLVCVSIPLLIVAVLFPGSIGGGDVKLTAASGLFLGWKALLISVAAGFLLAGVCVGSLLAAGKIGKKDSFPLGAFLCIGMAIGIFEGHWLWK